MKDEDSDTKVKVKAKKEDSVDAKENVKPGMRLPRYPVCEF